jgi:hypothetical protein
VVHLAEPAETAAAAVKLRHDGCGAPIIAELTCTAGHGPLTARETTPEPGPGAIAAA